MPNLRPLIACLFLLFLLGCGGSEAPKLTAEDVKAQMVGITEEETLICLGKPLKKATEDGHEIWTYRYGTCIVDLTWENSQVKSTEYTYYFPKGAKLTDDDPCARVPEVVSCVRWLRRPTPSAAAASSPPEKAGVTSGRQN